MAQLKLIHKDFFSEIYESYFDDIPVRFIKNVFTSEIKYALRTRPNVWDLTV